MLSWLWTLLRVVQVLAVLLLASVAVGAGHHYIHRRGEDELTSAGGGSVGAARLLGAGGGRAGAARARRAAAWVRCLCCAVAPATAGLVAVAAAAGAKLDKPEAWLLDAHERLREAAPFAAAAVSSSLSAVSAAVVATSKSYAVVGVLRRMAAAPAEAKLLLALAAIGLAAAICCGNAGKRMRLRVCSSADRWCCCSRKASVVVAVSSQPQTQTSRQVDRATPEEVVAELNRACAGISAPVRLRQPLSPSEVKAVARQALLASVAAKAGVPVAAAEQLSALASQTLSTPLPPR